MNRRAADRGDHIVLQRGSRIAVTFRINFTQMPSPMFGQSKPVVLDRYGRRGARRSVPRWLILLLTGVAIGAGGVVVIQERYLPPRLSAAESDKLRGAFEQADAERQRLKAELADASRKLVAALDDKKRLGTDLATSREAGDRLRELASSLVASLPPDPRGGAVEVRAARFTVDDGALRYDVVLTRERSGGKPLSGVMQLMVTGKSPGRAADSTATLKPIVVSVGPFENLRGSVPLPDGFTPRQTTLHVLDRVGGKLLGMRVLAVK